MTAWTSQALSVAGTVGALNGNVAPNRTVLSFTITGLEHPQRCNLLAALGRLRLIPGADDGLSVDDFSLTA